MIKFFRRIRQRLLSENKFSKYLLYAIGEIALVVIGILIALYINNQNEVRKSEERVEVLLGEIMVELEEFIAASNHQLKFYYDKEVIFNLITTDQLTYNDYSNNNYQGMFTTTTLYSKSNKQRKAYDNIISELNAVPAKYKTIINELNVLYNDQFNEYYSNLLEELSLENIKKRADHYEWYSYNVPNEQNKEMIAFMLEDYRYKSEVKYFANMVSWHKSYVIRDKINAIKAYTSIASALNIKADLPNIYFDPELISNLTGTWESEQFPGIITKVYETDGVLNFEFNIDNEVHTFYPIRESIVMDSFENYYELSVINGQYIAKRPDGVIMKKTKN